LILAMNKFFALDDTDRSLGVPEDFRDANYRLLLVNAIFWTAGLEVPEDGTAGGGVAE
jgi:hypothetical protein